MGLITTCRPSEQKKAVFFQSLITMKVLVATEKPFAKAAVDGIREIVQGAGYQMALLEKYTDMNQLLTAVQDADALIVRSDKVTAEVEMCIRDRPPSGRSVPYAGVCLYLQR